MSSVRPIETYGRKQLNEQASTRLPAICFRMAELLRINIWLNKLRIRKGVSSRREMGNTLPSDLQMVISVVCFGMDEWLQSGFDEKSKGIF